MHVLLKFLKLGSTEIPQGNSRKLLLCRYVRVALLDLNGLILSACLSGQHLHFWAVEGG